MATAHARRAGNLHLVCLVAVTALTGCGAEPATPQPTGEVTILAAASLTVAFTTIGRDFEAGHPGTSVVFTFLGGPTLAQKINQGARADVLAAADPTTMRPLSDAGNTIGPPAVFARDQLVIAVPEGNPRSIAGPADLVGPGVKVALCAEAEPCGAAARTALVAAGVRVTPAIRVQDVKAALTKLRLGEVDAALVYRTAARAASSEVDAVEFPESARAINDYPIAVLRNAPNPELGRAFVAYVLSEPGAAVLTNAGYKRP